jgi:hypothetical protein
MESDVNNARQLWVNMERVRLARSRGRIGVEQRVILCATQCVAHKSLSVPHALSKVAFSQKSLRDYAVMWRGMSSSGSYT